MKSFQNRNWAVLTLAMALVFWSTSCSKKDVQSEEPSFSASETGGGTAMGETTEGAGEAGVPAADLQVVYFAFDSFSLTSEGREAIKANAQWLKDNPNANVQIEGHCDERGTTEYNLALGERRAKAAKDYIVKLGVASSRVSTVSYGEERPADPGHDEAAWAKNRRASFIVTQ